MNSSSKDSHLRFSTSECQKPEIQADNEAMNLVISGYSNIYLNVNNLICLSPGSFGIQHLELKLANLVKLDLSFGDVISLLRFLN